MSIDKISYALSKYCDVEENVPLSSLTSLRIGGIARYVVYPLRVVSLIEVIKILKDNNIKFKVFGKGTNILCSDNYYDGAIIKLDRGFKDFYFDDNSCIAQAGCSIISIAYEAMKNSLSGLEFASGIPASVGGVTYMNAGAYNMEMKDVISEVFVLRDQKLEWIKNEECDFSYRHSIFHDHLDWIIVAVKFNFSSKPSEAIKKVIDERRKRRIQTQPLEKFSAGSTFKNPEGYSSWKLIDDIGYRGKMIGGAMVSLKHSNFLINENMASASDFMELVEEIQTKVKEEFGVDLEMEVERFNW